MTSTGCWRCCWSGTAAASPSESSDRGTGGLATLRCTLTAGREMAGSYDDDEFEFGVGDGAFSLHRGFLRSRGLLPGGRLIVALRSLELPPAAAVLVHIVPHE